MIKRGRVSQVSSVREERHRGLQDAVGGAVAQPAYCGRYSRRGAVRWYPGYPSLGGVAAALQQPPPKKRPVSLFLVFPPPATRAALSSGGCVAAPLLRSGEPTTRLPTRSPLLCR